MAEKMIPFRTPDGTEWGVEVQLPGSSNALVVFHHPDGRTSRKDRYAWIEWRGPEARDVTDAVAADKVRAALNENELRTLFTRSMLIGGGLPGYSIA